MPLTRAKAGAAASPKIRMIAIKNKEDGLINKIDLSAVAKIVDGTLANKGIVQLQSVIDDSETTAATPKAVNEVKKIADANTTELGTIKQSIDEALPGEGTLADKLKEVAFISKANVFAENQTIASKAVDGTETGSLTLKNASFDAALGTLDPSATAVNAAVVAKDKNGQEFAKFGVNVAGENRTAGITLTDSEGGVHGITVKTDLAGTKESVVALAPDTPQAAEGNEIVTAKWAKAELGKVDSILVDATGETRGLVKLVDDVNSDSGAAVGGLAASPLAVKTVNDALTAVTDVVGATAENAALKTVTNEFEKSQVIKLSADVGTDGAGSLSGKSSGYDITTGAFDDGASGATFDTSLVDKNGVAVVGTSYAVDPSKGNSAKVTVHSGGAEDKVGSLEVKFDSSKAESGAFVATAPSTLEDASGSEIVTADWAKKRLDNIQGTLKAGDADTLGLLKLSDATQGTEDAASGQTAATPLAVKTVEDKVLAVTNVVGVDAENAALKTTANEFAEDQTFKKNIIVTPSASGSGVFGNMPSSGDGASDSGVLGVALKDTTGANTVAGLTLSQTSEKSNVAALGVADGVGGEVAGITITRTADGVVTATAPETAEGASGAEIVTAGWADAKIKSVEGNLQDATDVQRGFVTLSDDVAGTEDAATGHKAATPLAVKTVNDALTAVTNVVGVNAENAALVNKANTFAEPQKITVAEKTLNLGGAGVEAEGADDDALVLGAGFGGRKAEILIAANGSITRTELPANPDDSEIATVGYVRSLGNLADSLSAGSWSIALYDFTQPINHSQMEDGVFYSVPFNKLGQYLQIDKETGKPSDVQAPGVSDHEVSYFQIMYKAPSSGKVVDLGQRKIAPDFNDVPLVSADNTFTGLNTFEIAPQKTTPSVDPELGDVADNALVSKSELVAYFEKHNTTTHVVSTEPDVDSMIPGDVYFIVEPDEQPAP